jgi:AcrR family transcriptional regulator
MRVTAETKRKTRGRILEAARNLFLEKGFDPATTREIASAAKIAAGTLFNYFPSKEALGMTIIAEALEEAKVDFAARCRGGGSLEELLFLHVVTQLRRLEPHRRYVGPVIETAMRPLTDVSDKGSQVRSDQLATATELIASNSCPGEPSFVSMHLYWTLYVGVLAFWSSDDSPNQKDSLVLLYQSLRVFVGFLRTGGREAGDRPLHL